MTKFAQKGCFLSKTKKGNTIFEFCIISAESDNFDLLEQVCPKRVFLVKKGKSEHHHLILRIRISQDTKCQLKMRVLICFLNCLF